MRPARLALFTLLLLACNASSPGASNDAVVTPPKPSAKAADAPQKATPADQKASVVHLAAASIKESPDGQATVREIARGQNAFMALLELGPNAEVPEHHDSTEEYIHVVRGTGTIYIDGKQDFVRPGTTVYMPADAKVSFRNGSAPMLVLQVFAGPEPAKKYDTWKEWEGRQGENKPEAELDEHAGHDHAKVPGQPKP